MVRASALVRMSLAAARAWPSKHAVASCGSISSICSSRVRASESSSCSLVLIHAACSSSRLPPAPAAGFVLGETPITSVTTRNRTNASTSVIGTHFLSQLFLTVSKQVSPDDTLWTNGHHPEAHRVQPRRRLSLQAQPGGAWAGAGGAAGALRPEGAGRRHDGCRRGGPPDRGGSGA